MWYCLQGKTLVRRKLIDCEEKWHALEIDLFINGFVVLCSSSTSHGWIQSTALRIYKYLLDCWIQNKNKTNRNVHTHFTVCALFLAIYAGVECVWTFAIFYCQTERSNLNFHDFVRHPYSIQLLLRIGFRFQFEFAHMVKTAVERYFCQ